LNFSAYIIFFFLVLISFFLPFFLTSITNCRQGIAAYCVLGNGAKESREIEDSLRAAIRKQVCLFVLRIFCAVTHRIGTCAYYESTPTF